MTIENFSLIVDTLSERKKINLRRVFLKFLLKKDIYVEYISRVGGTDNEIYTYDYYRDVIYFNGIGSLINNLFIWTCEYNATSVECVLARYVNGCLMRKGLDWGEIYDAWIEEYKKNVK